MNETCFLELNMTRSLLFGFHKEFEELDEEAVEQIVSRDGLRVYSELEVLTALVRWSVFECHRQQLDDRSENQRRVLDRLLWQVRFLVTPATLQLWETPVVAQLLTEEESSALLLAVQSSHGAHCSVDLLPDHIRAHWPQIGRPRNYLPVQGRPSPSESLGPHPSCRKSSCITEKIFVGLACIFEWNRETHARSTRFDFINPPTVFLLHISDEIPLMYLFVNWFVNARFPPFM